MLAACEALALSARYEDVWLLAGLRTPFADYMSALRSVSATDLGICVARALLQRSAVAARDVGAVFAGNLAQSSFDAYYLARHVGLYAELSAGAPALLVQRGCATGLETLLSAADQIALGKTQLALCVGTESMSRNPIASYTHRSGFRLGQVEFKDFLWESALDTAPGARLGETADSLAKHYGIGREEIDRFAAESFERAVKAWEAGVHGAEVEPVANQEWQPNGYAARGIRLSHQLQRFERDERVRPTSAQALGRLRPAFGGVHTAGSSAGIVDGAAAALLASGEYVRAHGLKPLARLRAASTVGVPPEWMGLGPVPALRALLAASGLSLAAIDRFEILEAFGAQYLAVERELELDRARVNVNGGAIALGHPIAASGLRQATAVAHELARCGGEHAVAAACGGGGHGVALLLQRPG
jgi:acetyl-CoA C-acetyltransferase